MKKLITLPYTFVMLNCAALLALYYFITHRENVWVKTQTQPISDNKMLSQEPKH